MSKANVKERKPVVRKGLSIKPRPLVREVPVPAERVDEDGKPLCAHRWVIASPEGAMSLGKCKICGAEREFPNSAEDYLWEREVPQSRWTGRSDWKSSDSGGSYPKGY